MECTARNRLVFTLMSRTTHAQLLENDHTVYTRFIIVSFYVWNSSSHLPVYHVPVLYTDHRQLVITHCAAHAQLENYLDRKDCSKLYAVRASDCYNNDLSLYDIVYNHNTLPDVGKN